MLKLIHYLFYGHCHKWKIIDKYSVLPARGGDIPIATDFILRCEKCGNIKKVRT